MQDELAAMQVEVADGWGRAIFQAICRAHFKNPPKLPPPVSIDPPARAALRPPPEPPRRVSLLEAVQTVVEGEVG